MKSSEREQIENQILLRSTGDLSPEECEALERVIETDPEAAEFARFVDEALPVGAAAPRDFAAEAIAEVPAPTGWWRPLIPIAAILIVLAIAIPHMLPSGKTFPAGVPFANRTAPRPERVTEDISQRIDRIESELSIARASVARGRYSRQPES